MQKQPGKPIRIAIVISSICLFMAYVVYSQRQHAQNVAPGSKSMVVDVSPKSAADTAQTNQNRPLKRSVTIVTAPVATNVSAGKSPPTMIAPGSKSGRIFDIAGQVSDLHFLQTTQAAPVHTTNKTSVKKP